MAKKPTNGRQSEENPERTEEGKVIIKKIEEEEKEGNSENNDE